MPSRPLLMAVLAVATVLLGWKCGATGDFWSPMSSLDAPLDGAYACPMLWTGSEALTFATLAPARYDPSTDAWRPMSTVEAPQTACRATLWTGSEAIVFAEMTSGARYDPVADTWTPIPAPMPPLAYVEAAVWTGTEALVWGQNASFTSGAGGRYDPSTDTWAPMTTMAAPSGGATTAVWSGTEMIAWTCTAVETVDCTNGRRADGGRYDPASDSWTWAALPICCDGVPAYESIWTGERMFLWGDVPWVYDPVANASEPLPVGGALCANVRETAPSGSLV